MISGTGLDMLKDSGKYPCSMCRKGAMDVQDVTTGFTRGVVAFAAAWLTLTSSVQDVLGLPDQLTVDQPLLSLKVRGRVLHACVSLLHESETWTQPRLICSACNMLTEEWSGGFL